ncbi:MAG: molybdopterin-dependent oxidoreductase [Bacteroidales bacterium]
MTKTWGVKELPKTLNENQYNSLENGLLKNIFIFGEDPLGCAQNKVKVSGWLSVADFVLVQDYFMTETAKVADLILPASFPVEIGGSFTNTQKTIQVFEAEIPSKVENDSIVQLSMLLKKFGLKGFKTSKDVMNEIISMLSAELPESNRTFVYTEGQDCNRMFNYGCDVIVKRFEENFDNAMKD